MYASPSQINCLFSDSLEVFFKTKQNKHHACFVVDGGGFFSFTDSSHSGSMVGLVWKWSLVAKETIGLLLCIMRKGERFAVTEDGDTRKRSEIFAVKVAELSKKSFYPCICHTIPAENTETWSWF